MIEVFAFLAVFPVQVLALSVLFPARFTRYVREQAASSPAERLARLYPDMDLGLARERFLARYRALNTGIAVLGLLLLGWLFTYMRRPDWDEGRVVVLLSVYFMVQFLPLVLVAWLGFRSNQAHRRSLLEGKRKALLQRRGLFDFISPFVVFLAAIAYFLFVAFVIHVQRTPFPGFALVGVLTLVYALQTFVVYRALYGKKSNPLETHAGRVRAIGLTVKVCVYSCIVCAVFFSFVFAVDLLALERWVPFAQCVCLLTTTLLSLASVTAPSRPPDTF